LLIAFNIKGKAFYSSSFVNKLLIKSPFEYGFLKF